MANPLALAVLAYLSADRCIPTNWVAGSREHGKDRNIKYNRGSLYMVVEQLRKAGFITEQETVRDTQRPERTVYASPTPAASNSIDWMRELVAEPREEYPHFGVALSLLTVLPPRRRPSCSATPGGADRAGPRRSAGVLEEASRQTASCGCSWPRRSTGSPVLDAETPLRHRAHRVAQADPGYDRVWHHELTTRGTGMNKISTALVIGGGIAGPVAALALRKAGIEATVYEAYPSTADGVGGSLALAPNGLAALRIVGADEAVSADRHADHAHGHGRSGRKRIGICPASPALPPLQLRVARRSHRALHDQAVAQGVRIELRQAPGRTRGDRDRHHRAVRRRQHAPAPTSSSAPTASAPPSRT